MLKSALEMWHRFDRGNLWHIWHCNRYCEPDSFITGKMHFQSLVEGHFFHRYIQGENSRHIVFVSVETKPLSEGTSQAPLFLLSIFVRLLTQCIQEVYTFLGESVLSQSWYSSKWFLNSAIFHHTFRDTFQYCCQIASQQYLKLIILNYIGGCGVHEKCMAW